MALTDNNEPWSPPIFSGNVPAREELPLRPRPASLLALARLGEIRAETLETTDLARFLRAAVSASAALMLMGILAVMLAGGASLQQEFAWSVLVLAGVGAMLRVYIKSVAQGFDRAPLREAAKDLRAVLFYAGFAWGAGAFLLLGSNPIPMLGLGFVVLPSLLLIPLLRDRAACMGFMAPATALTAVAILVQPWSNAMATLVLLLIVQSSIAAALVFAGRIAPVRDRSSLPAGLSLH